MKNSNNTIKLSILCGYASEATAWKVLSDISKELISINRQDKAYGNICTENIFLDEKGDFHLVAIKHYTRKESSPSDIWELGSVIFELLMGVAIFGGKGERIQTTDTPIPTFRKDKYSENLGKLVERCLSFDTNKRPNAEEVLKIATTNLSKYNSQKVGRISKDEKKHIHNDTLKFWPEKII